MEEKAVSLSMDSWPCCGPGSLPEVYLLGMSSSGFLEGTGTRKINKGDPVLSLQSCVCVNEPATARSMAPALSHDLPDCSNLNLLLNLLCLRSTPAGETRQCPSLVIPTKGKDHWQKSEWAKLSVWGIKAICLPILLCHLPWGWGGGSETAPACFIYWSNADKDTGILGLYFSLESKKEVWFPTRLSLWHGLLAGLRHFDMKPSGCCDAEMPVVLI